MQMLLHLPDDLVSRFRQSVPARGRSDYVRKLLESALPKVHDPLYQAALLANQDIEEETEIQLWSLTNADGLDPNETFDADKLARLCQP